jgi:V/A-type H+-transporting ATPase subunit B
MIEVKYKSVLNIRDPLIFAKFPRAQIGEIVRISVGAEERVGQVIEIKEETVVIQVFQGTSEISRDSSVIPTGETKKLDVTLDLFGRIFDGLGQPADGGLPVESEVRREVSGAPLNPSARAYPKEFIETGISAIDGLLSLVRGQKLPIFSGSGLPHNRLVAQIVRQSRIPEEKFGVVLGGIGLNQEEADSLIKDLIQAEVMDRTIVFMNLYDDPTIERLLIPRLALTASEYMAFEHGYDMLVVLTDITSYCEALREVSIARGEIPGLRGYPGYMYTDLATIFERSGRILGKEGSVTLIPVISMPDFDITHPIPDLTGFITEGQIVLKPTLNMKGVYPPIDILPSLSRLMKDGVGEGSTREDHMDIANKIYASYSRGRSAMDLALVVGEDALTREERHHLSFAEEFENRFINQGGYETRSIEETLDLGLELLKIVE